MSRRKNEDVELVGHCDNEPCEEWGLAVTVEGRFDFEGEFEAYDDEAMHCKSCGDLLYFPDLDS